MTLKLSPMDISVMNLYSKGSWEFTDYLECNPGYGGCGKVNKLGALKDPGSCCSYYSYSLLYQPELAYGGHEIEGWTAIRKPTAMFMNELEYTLQMGMIPHKLERRVAKAIHGDTKAHITVMVPKHLKGRAEWLIESWINAGQYQIIQARKVLMEDIVNTITARAMLDATSSMEYTYSGFRAVYITGGVLVYDDWSDAPILPVYGNEVGWARWLGAAI